MKPDRIPPHSTDSEHTFSVCMLASGSRGNAIYISNGATSVLIDAGLSGVEIERRLKSRGLCPENLDALIVSHEHADHIHGVGVLSRKYGLPVYMNADTQKAAYRLGKVNTVKPFNCSTPFMINTLSIYPFPISHDAADPVGFTLEQGGIKIGIATDLGVVTALVKEHLKECALLVLEANHDPEMLTQGPYPWPLKQRIKSRVGHLANEDTHDLLQELQHDRLQHVVLAHLSETNNTPEKAYQAVSPALTRCFPTLSVATQGVSGEILRV
ncbi:MAG: MBL fold metallo-hydrolase [Pseudomonadota bacterium]